MASILPGFEYDIFISYRHNDNRSGWVTEFVRALQEELAATIKDPVSVYFDANPHDGLLETHNVDKSLEGKLTCLLFIPILSQTYCDPKSFAWQHEFVAFNKLASNDSFGRDIKLSNGNVASRILPIKIHDLDAEDKSTIENETGAVLRAIEFIYREPGVNRPLTITDNKTDNQNKTDYKNQINKVANSVKELIAAMKHPHESKVNVGPGSVTIDPPGKRNFSTIAAVLLAAGLLAFSLFYFMGLGEKLSPVIDKSIAVLPFDNLSNDPEQDYFSSGITEDILNQLAKIADLDVKSRTSTLQYKNTTRRIPEIGEELGVANVVGGSVRRFGDQVRISVQLIDTKTDRHLWSETYDRDFKDVLALQSEIALKIANSLKARLTEKEKENISKEASTDVTAYDYFLKAREMTNRLGFGLMGNSGDLNNAMMLVNNAIKLDNNFGPAFALKGKLWLKKKSVGVSEKMWTDSASYYSSRAIEIDPSLVEGYLVQADVLSTVGKIKEAHSIIKKAYKISPNDPDVQIDYGWFLIYDQDESGANLVLKSIESMYQAGDPRYYRQIGEVLQIMDNPKEAEGMYLKARSLDPSSNDIIYMLYNLYERTGQYDKALDILQFGAQESGGIIDAQAEIHTLKKDYALAAKLYERYKQIESSFEDSTQTIPLRHRLGYVYAQLGRKKEADALIREQLQILNDAITGKRGIGAFARDLGAVYYDRSLCLVYLNQKAEALKSLDSAFHYGWRGEFYYHHDPFLVEFQNDPDYRIFLKKLDDFNAFKKDAFTKAFNKAKASKELKGLLER